MLWWSAVILTLFLPVISHSRTKFISCEFKKESPQYICFQDFELIQQAKLSSCPENLSECILKSEKVEKAFLEKVKVILKKVCSAKNAGDLDKIDKLTSINDTYEVQLRVDYRCKKDPK